jgi:hypothetical protein
VPFEIAHKNKFATQTSLCQVESQTKTFCLTLLAADGTFAFVNVPPGLYTLNANPPGQGQPEILIREIRVSENQTLVQNLTFERRFAFSGKVTRSDGSGLAGERVWARWESPDGKVEFADSIDTDANGRYTLCAPFREASCVRLSGSSPTQQPYRHVTAGRTDLDFSL